MQPFPKLTLVTGGASSGKSGWAERLVKTADCSLIYIATAQAFDDEMAQKIARHQADRGAEWQNIEAPLDLVTALGGHQPDQVILVDCLTMWLSNHMLAENDPEIEAANLLKQLASMINPVVLVTNEVGQSVVPDNALARRFQTAQGRLNQRIAQQSDLVVAVMAGLPMALKGHIPVGAQ